VSILSLLTTWAAAHLSALWRRIDRKKAAIVLAFPVLILWGDTLLPALGHGLHVLIEIIELTLEHFLEWAFHLSPRQAQVVIAWSGLLLAIYLTVILLRKAYRAARRAFFAALARWRQLVDSADAGFWFRTAVVAGASLGAALYLFF
jgi:hypothetical protein